MSSFEDFDSTQWIRDRLLSVPSGAGVPVGALIPPGYEAYCRIFHPARRQGRKVRWAEVAAENGKVSHPLMQWHSINGKPSYQRFNQPDWGSLPDIGSLDQAEARLLVRLLASFTAVDSRCCMCFWEGQYPGNPEHAVQIGGYEYFVSRARLELIPTQDSPHIWWPEYHRSWCVVTDIDSGFTLIGGSAECVNALLASPDLEVLTVSLEHRIDVFGDLPNS